MPPIEYGKRGDDDQEELGSSEADARKRIDAQLTAAGWVVQDYKKLNIRVSLGVAVREFPTETGPVDYMLFIDGKAAGTLEAKKIGATLGGVAEQSSRYARSGTQVIQRWGDPLPFTYESTSVETFFRDQRDPNSRSRRLFTFHRPETLHEWLQEEDTLRARLGRLPPLVTTNLRQCQIEAITGLDKSLAQNHPRALIQMATGAGKTFTAVTFAYRLIKYAKARRILFLVDRKSLGTQAENEFQQYVTPDGGRKFTELYNIQHLKGSQFNDVAKVTITTIQRLYSQLSGREIDDELDEKSGFEAADVIAPREIGYNPRIPIEEFDFIVVDECHRSIYNLWRQVLEYFDAFLIGLTATPSKATFGFFDKNLVAEYSHEDSVADGVNVGYDIYRIKTEVSENGVDLESGYEVERRNRKTRESRWETLDEEEDYAKTQIDRDLVVPDQIRTVIRTFRDKLFTDLFPGRTWVPKTLIFAKSDDHAERIVQIVREEFGKGNDFCKKITYRVTGESTDYLIKAFRTDPVFRIAVTVDMISTGTDIKPLECLIFMRDVKSQVYFDQMKGRGTRTLTETELRSVTADAVRKTHFVLVDAVGVTESDKGDCRSLERARGVSFEKLMHKVALGARDEDTLSSLANRLARLDRTLDPRQRERVKEVAGKQVTEITGDIIHTLNPDAALDAAKSATGKGQPAPEECEKARKKLADIAVEPFNRPEVRDLLESLKMENEQTIDHGTIDVVTGADYDKEKGKQIIQTFKDFIEKHKDEITALQIIYSQPYGKRRMTYDAIKKLADELQDPPYNLAPERVWSAYANLEKSRARNAGPATVLTNIISLIRFAAGAADVLEPFPDVVDRRFDEWLKQQQTNGKRFTAEQMEWLRMIKERISLSGGVERDDFDLAPFTAHGGLGKALKVFGPETDRLIEDLNGALVA
ncbi:MAG: DEAD/DEAH box helicase family protein [Nitrospinae bacterium]|nr:DEAD/DEAH box helicase family protein [Nitrospinota bacterium]